MLPFETKRLNRKEDDCITNSLLLISFRFIGYFKNKRSYFQINA
ncbi:hypothetical protein NEIELOOT_02242 [Neisseria elongata subsp. glycolytica ATCC 29315]|uniref:Uncharacterized protein n=1 Tax=Neisseria elongata subsp. glycolytica ATCC 29315 TaxID=546263 RepID=D4DT40_NEIEG|nr:hypothetical protein NEIELOOT_02242 [Neisseria elongata subsp. glycolytica ATCC 29315]